MKIGILTYHRAHNYGAMLQAFALRRYLQSKGHEVHFIDYCSGKMLREYSVWRLPKSKFLTTEFLVDLLSLCLTAMRRTIRHQRFCNFSKRYLGVGAKPEYSDGDTVFRENIDLCIVGSDQVWRNRESDGRILGFNPVFFGSTLPDSVPCISYAASMGVIKPTDADKSFLKQALRRFHTLMVREQSLKQFLDELEFPSDVVCDPVMLLNKGDWNELLPSTRFAEKPYVLYYELLESKETRRAAQAFASRLGACLKVITARVHPMPRKGVLQTASPLQFIHAVRDADYVICTSFHGTAFSILFEKQFYVTALRSNSGRVVSLLGELGIDNRYVETLPDTISNIDYASVEPLKQEFVNKSANSLNRYLAQI
jgi:hypothetical protein